jgi:hypothetical protein
MAGKQQWHPVLAELLRPLVESHFEVQTDVPVGDRPRQADVVLLRRTRAGSLSSLGLWSRLTPWNALEYKGPSVSPRDEHLDALIEVGLGIHHRLNEERRKRRQPVVGPEAMSFWYLANRLGRRLLAGWRGRVPGMRMDAPGVWRCEVIGHPVFLVSGMELPVEESSLPLHLVGKEPPTTEEAVARLVAGRADLWERYSAWLLTLHRAAYEGVQNMAKATKEKFQISLEPVIETMGLDWVIQQVGPERLIEQLGLKRFIDQLEREEKLRAKLTPELRRKLKRLAEE